MKSQSRPVKLSPRALDGISNLINRVMEFEASHPEPQPAEPKKVSRKPRKVTAERVVVSSRTTE